MQRRCRAGVLSFLVVAGVVACVRAADWPQFMRDAARTGDAADERLELPLGLVAQVRLEDAVTTAPAVVGGRVYVVDQMGTAYCIDPEAGRVVWRAAPDGERASGSNTSSPAVVAGRVCYGTTAGNLHILDAADGKLVCTVRVGSPILAAPAAANGSIYVQALDAVLRCFDRDGKPRWTWDHYARYVEPAEVTQREEPRRGHPGSYQRPHYGGGEVAVSGRRIVTSFGWDLACIEDKDVDASLLWCTRAPCGRDGAIPMASSIAAGFVNTAGMGADGVLALMRSSLDDGRLLGTLNQGAFPCITPAARGEIAVGRNNGWLRDEFQLCDFAKRRETLWQDPKDATPCICSHAIAAGHLVVGTFTGELMAIPLAPKRGEQPFRYRTPHGRPIGSAPAVSGGRVYFGCDDGSLYVLGPGGKLEPKTDAEPDVHRPLGARRSATGRQYDWPSTCGNPANTCLVDDPGLRPPLRVAWAARGFGHFKTPAVAADGDLFTLTLGGIVTCMEQASGRLRWRVRVPPDGWQWGNSSGMLAADGRLYVPRAVGRPTGTMFCLDQATGATLWTAPIGTRGIWERSSPVLAAGRIAFATAAEGTPPRVVVQAWDARTGEPAWKVEMNVSANHGGSMAGCSDGTTMYFTAGAQQWQWKQEGDCKRGEAVAIDARSGRVLWRSNEVFGTAHPALAPGRLLLCEFGNALQCADPADGKLLWKNKPAAGSARLSVGADYVACRGYGGGAMKIRLDDGTACGGLEKGGQLGGDAHACGNVALTADLSFAITVAGLHVRDARTGALLWLSPGFAPRGCVNAILADGRVFFPAAANGTVYCFEPAGQGR